MNRGSASKRGKDGVTVVRPVYDPTIREVIAEGNLAKMRRIYGQAKDLLDQQGDLKAAVERLREAIQEREQSE